MTHTAYHRPCTFPTPIIKTLLVKPSIGIDVSLDMRDSENPVIPARMGVLYYLI